MNLLAFSNPLNQSQCLENKRYCESIWFEADDKHFVQELHGREIDGVARNAADDSVAETETELSIMGVSKKDGANVEKVRGGGGGGGGEKDELGNEIGERERGCFNGDAMDLLEVRYGFAGIEGVRKKMELQGIHTQIWIWLL